MKNSKNNIWVKLFVTVGVIAGILALILSVLPFNLISFAPATIAILAGIFALIISKRSNGKMAGGIIVLSLAVLSMLIGGVSELTYENKVEENADLQITLEKDLDSNDIELLIDELPGVIDEAEEESFDVE